ncbi:MAG: hypothetical protein J6Z02_06935 [Lachnospiraceae bacterium]|nr:hypothetical protein [Lachnospiraceae bacterium]
MTDSKKGTRSKKKKSGELRQVQPARSKRPTAPAKNAGERGSGKAKANATPESFFA